MPGSQGAIGNTNCYLVAKRFFSLVAAVHEIEAEQINAPSIQPLKRVRTEVIQSDSSSSEEEIMEMVNPQDPEI